jgi:hypothetical protein
MCGFSSTDSTTAFSAGCIAQGKGRVVVVVSGHDGAAVYRGFAAQIAQLGYDDLGAPPLKNQKFADSPLEEGVWSEPVSEVGFFGAWELRVIPRPLWTIIEAEKGYFGLENGGVSVFAPWQLPPLSGS